MPKKKRKVKKRRPRVDRSLELDAEIERVPLPQVRRDFNRMIFGGGGDVAWLVQMLHLAREDNEKLARENELLQRRVVELREAYVRVHDLAVGRAAKKKR